MLTLSTSLTACSGDDAETDSAEPAADETSETTGSEETEQTEESGAGDVPVTPASLAWLATQHMPVPDSAVPYDYTDAFGADAVGIEALMIEDAVTYGVVVVPELPEQFASCPEEGTVGGCEVDGETIVRWQPASDAAPGSLTVIQNSDDGAALAFMRDSLLTGDPQELDLAIGVEELTAVAQDPRTAMTTTQEAVDGGAELTWFS